MTDEFEKLRRQTAALAAFGGRSLRTHDLDGLLREACEIVSASLDTKLVKVLELLPGGDTMLVREGVNWRPGVVGHTTFGAHLRSPSGFALQTDTPVISADTTKEDRFDIPSFMWEHDVRSMVNVVIRGERRAWGVLEVDSPELGAFDQADADFLQTYANLLAGTIERLETEAALNQAVHRAELLLGELQHRVRNLLLNIRSLARRTRRSSGSLEEFATAFDARLQALGRTQDLLTRGDTGTIGLEETLRQELEAHGMNDERVSISGPSIELTAGAAQALSMAFHELATNAGKHGAFAQGDGGLTVNWDLVEEDQLSVLIRWQETGVAIETPPERRGFGSETIEKSISYMLAGTSRLEFTPTGVFCEIHFPLQDQEPPPEPDGGV